MSSISSTSGSNSAQFNEVAPLEKRPVLKQSKPHAHSANPVKQQVELPAKQAQRQASSAPTDLESLRRQQEQEFTRHGYRERNCYATGADLLTTGKIGYIITGVAGKRSDGTDIYITSNQTCQLEVNPLENGINLSPHEPFVPKNPSKKHPSKK